MSYQPRRGRGRGWRGRRGYRGGGYRGRGRGRGRGAANFAKKEHQNFAWKMLEQYTKNQPFVVCNFNKDQFIAIAKGSTYNSNKWTYQGYTIIDKHDKLESALIYTVKTNKWTEFNMTNNEYKFIATKHICTDDKNQKIYIITHYLNQADCASLKSWSEQYEQYKAEQTEQSNQESSRLMEQYVQQQSRNQAEQTVQSVRAACQQRYPFDRPVSEQYVQEMMQQWNEQHSQLLTQQENAYRSQYPQSQQAQEARQRLQKKLNDFQEQFVISNHGVFMYDANENTMKLLETFSKEETSSMYDSKTKHLLFIMDNVLYKFVYGTTNKLMKWDGQTEKFIVHQEYKQIPNGRYIYQFAVFCESQNCVVVMNCTNESQGYRARHSGTSNDVYTLNLKNGSMEKVTVKMQSEFYGYNLISYQNCVIMVPLNDKAYIWIYHILQKQIRKSKIQLTTSGEAIILGSTMHLVNEQNHFSMEMKHIIPSYWLNEKQNQNNIILEEKKMENKESHKLQNEQQFMNMKLSKMENMLNRMNSTLTILKSSMDKMRNDMKLMNEKQKRDKQEIISMINSFHSNDEIKENDSVNVVKEWLREFGLDRYCLCFTSNGYDSLEFIEGIESKEELFEIGIKLKGHQTQLMIQIKKLKQRNCEIEGQNVLNTQ